MIDRDKISVNPRECMQITRVWFAPYFQPNLHRRELNPDKFTSPPTQPSDVTYNAAERDDVWMSLARFEFSFEFWMESIFMVSLSFAVSVYLKSTIFRAQLNWTW